MRKFCSSPVILRG
uniref:Uncharacterized protein n=1 Tax=Rhizophora mucronata TaxID=61149 RepID=A0A2P2QHT7_RHIMU